MTSNSSAAPTSHAVCPSPWRKDQAILEIDRGNTFFVVRADGSESEVQVCLRFQSPSDLYPNAPGGSRPVGVAERSDRKSWPSQTEMVAARLPCVLLPVSESERPQLPQVLASMDTLR
jgi:hypothetical protein